MRLGPGRPLLTHKDPFEKVAAGDTAKNTFDDNIFYTILILDARLRMEWLDKRLKQMAPD